MVISAIDFDDLHEKHDIQNYVNLWKLGKRKEYKRRGMYQNVNGDFSG